VRVGAMLQLMADGADAKFAFQRPEHRFDLGELHERLAPCRLLLIVDLSEIENRSLHRFVGCDTAVFYDAKVAVILAVFLALSS